MAQALTGSAWSAFETHSENLSEALSEAANVVSGINLLHPTAAVRIFHNTNDDGIHDVFIICEGF